MLNGSGYVGDLQTLIFGPARAYQIEMKAWNEIVQARLDQQYPKSAAASAPDQALVIQLINDAVAAGSLPRPPVFDSYTVDSSYTLAQERNSQVGGNVNIGINIPTPALQLSAGANAAANVKDTAQEIHKVTAEIRTLAPPQPVADDVYGPVVRDWIRSRFPAPGTTGIPAPAPAK